MSHLYRPSGKPGRCLRFSGHTADPEEPVSEFYIAHDTLPHDPVHFTCTGRHRVFSGPDLPRSTPVPLSLKGLTDAGHLMPGTGLAGHAQGIRYSSGTAAVGIDHLSQQKGAQGR